MASLLLKYDEVLKSVNWSAIPVISQFAISSSFHIPTIYTIRAHFGTITADVVCGHILLRMEVRFPQFAATFQSSEKVTTRDFFHFSLLAMQEHHVRNSRPQKAIYVCKQASLGDVDLLQMWVVLVTQHRLPIQHPQHKCFTFNFMLIFSDHSYMERSAIWVAVFMDTWNLVCNCSFQEYLNILVMWGVYFNAKKIAQWTHFSVPLPIWICR